MFLICIYTLKTFYTKEKEIKKQRIDFQIYFSNQNIIIGLNSSSYKSSAIMSHKSNKISIHTYLEIVIFLNIMFWQVAKSLISTSRYFATILSFMSKIIDSIFYDWIFTGYLSKYFNHNKPMQNINLNHL